ncbi:SpoIID/LytB domain-containing protein [Psychrobacillus vulpis]|uniref:SpoIID/LytB domain-containing protein n=1 Tax=Psychrobacillus vulpis TaxID=2325572 RepID=A0A544TVB1_9BACI|nr:SpoIID/LytB domain-containing protein [Psychrobacillus vulpis]TQR21371.1 SpoIID/LytB domain-containing protein [Psychrobacillus vulpis]
MSKKWLTVLSVAILSLMTTNTAFAFTQESYSKQVSVEVHNTSTTSLHLNGIYKLENLSTNEMFYALPDTSITFSQVNGEVSIYQIGATMYSSKGFALHALSGNEKMVVFTSDVDGKKGATSDYETIKTYKAFQGAYYVNEFTNANGELWYSVTDEQGVSSWIPAKDASVGSVVKQPLGKTPNGTQYRSSFNVVKSGANVQIVNRLDLENYLKGVIPNESYASWHQEALKAQAVAARSYTLSKAGILSSTTKDQMYKGFTSEKTSTNSAVDATNGLVVKSGGKLVQAYYYAASGGRTANIGEVWNTAQVPHFVSVDDSIEKSPYDNWSVNIPATNILTKFGFSTSAQLLDVKLTKGGSNGEVSAVTVVTSAGEKTITGNETVMRGLFLDANNTSLKSNWFDIQFTKPSGVTDLAVQQVNGTTPITSLSGTTVQTATGTETIPSGSVNIQTNGGIVSTTATSGIPSITVNGKGYGHRIGMSQWGAKARADAGWTYDRILKHYYQGATIEKY